MGGIGASMELDAVAAVVAIQSLCKYAKWALLSDSCPRQERYVRKLNNKEYICAPSDWPKLAVRGRSTPRCQIPKNKHVCLENADRTQWGISSEVFQGKRQYLDKLPAEVMYFQSVV